MAAQVEVHSGEAGRTMTGGRLHLSPLTNSSNTSPSINQSHIITPEPKKPVPGPKPRLTPKPFAVENKNSIKPILAPKPQTKPRPESTNTTGYKPELPNSPKPQQPVAIVKPRPVSINSSRPASTSFRTSTKVNTGQTTKPVHPFKPAPPFDSVDANKSMPPLPAERQKPKNQMTPMQGGASIARAKSLGFLNQIEKEDEQNKSLTVVPPRPKPRGSRPRPVSAIFLNNPELPVPAPRLAGGNPLSSDLTYKFESIGLSLHRKATKADVKECTPKDISLSQKTQKEKISTLGQSTDVEGKQSTSDEQSNNIAEEMIVKETEDQRGVSIKSRIHLLLDSSSAPETVSSRQISDILSPEQTLSESEPQVGVKQLIKQLTEDTTPTQSPVMKPAMKPRHLPTDFTKKFSSERLSDFGNVSLSDPTEYHEISKDPQRRIDAVNPTDQMGVDFQDQLKKINSITESTEAEQASSATSNQSGPTVEMQTVRASLFDNIVERSSVTNGADLLSNPPLRVGSKKDKGTLVTAMYKDYISPSILRVNHTMDTVQGMGENRAVSESIPSAQWEDKAMTLNSRHSEGNRTMMETTSLIKGEPASAMAIEQQPRYLRIGSLQKWPTAGVAQEAGVQNATLNHSQREKEMDLNKDKDRQKEADHEEIPGAPKRMKTLQIDEKPKPKATYFALTGQIQESVSSLDTGSDIIDSAVPSGDFAVGSGQVTSQGKVAEIKRNLSINETSGEKKQGKYEDVRRMSHISPRQVVSVLDMPTADIKMGVVKSAQTKEDERQNGKMKVIDGDKQRQMEIEKQALLQFSQMKEREMQREFERRKAFEREKQKQRELQTHSLQESELGQQKDMGKQRQLYFKQEKANQQEQEMQSRQEVERQRELERQREFEKQRQKEMHRQREQEKERKQKLQRQREQELERQQELMRQKEQEMERPLEQMSIREQEKEKLRELQRQQELMRLREQEIERQQEQVRLKEQEKEIQQELRRLREQEKERWQQFERQQELMRLSEQEEERQREVERQQELMRLREQEEEKLRELQRQQGQMRLREQEIERHREQVRLKEQEKETQQELRRLREQEKERRQQFGRQQELMRLSEQEEEQQREVERQQELMRLREQEEERRQQFERQQELMRLSEQEEERQREVERQQELMRLREQEEEQQREVERQQELMRLREQEEERQQEEMRGREQEMDKKRELEWQREYEKEKRRELERHAEQLRQREQEIERQREVERQNTQMKLREQEKERKQEQVRLREQEMERHRELERQKEHEKERRQEFERPQEQLRQREQEMDQQQELERQQEHVRLREQELEKRQELERRQEKGRLREQEMERRRELKRQQELLRQREQEMEREREVSMQQELERREPARQQERVRLGEQEMERQQEFKRQQEQVRQKEQEMERMRELEQQQEQVRLREQEKERQWGVHMQQELEQERQREWERQRQREEERQSALDRETLLLEMQRNKRMEELERGKEREEGRLSHQNLKQKENERYHFIELEKQWFRENTEKTRQMALEQEMLRLKGIDKEWEKQRQMERECEEDIEREKLKELDRLRDLQRGKQLHAEKQYQRLIQQAPQNERLRWEAEREKMEKAEAEKMRQIARLQEAERHRLKEKHSKEEHERIRLDQSPLRPKVVDVDSLLRAATSQHIDPSLRWKEPSPRAEEPYKPSILDVDSFISQSQPYSNQDLLSVASIQEVDSNFGTILHPAPERDITWKAPPQTSVDFTSPVWTLSTHGPRELQPTEVAYNKSLHEPRKHTTKVSPDQLLFRQDGQSPASQRHWRRRQGEPLYLDPFVQREATTGVSGSTPVDQVWLPRELKSQDNQEEVWNHRRSQGSQELNRMRSRSMSRRSAPSGVALEKSLFRIRSRSAHREQDHQTWEQQKQDVSGEDKRKDSATPVGETDSQYGTWETGLRTDDSSESNLSPSPRKTAPSHPQGEHDIFDGPHPPSKSENQPLLFPDAPTTLLDTGVLRSRVQLGKKRAPRTRPSRAARQNTTQAEAEVPTSEEWLYRDSTEEKVERKMDEVDSEEQATGADAAGAFASQPQRIALFPGVDSLALKVQLKKRSDSDNQTDAPSPSLASRSPKSPFLPRAARVLLPASGKENGLPCETDL
ncbi:trichohyalin isoform X2 [Phyllopteryx taeniolatus]|uniref:trichohyalin isoform X2 n=1 Tax=Phyllopteryx taeniolatus TaxID=161469 RepID=UPI002AD1DCA7|nr:trichohyalin isoform X2 [Phyllopteryx taeniolatus]